MMKHCNQLLSFSLLLLSTEAFLARLKTSPAVSTTSQLFYLQNNGTLTQVESETALRRNQLKKELTIAAIEKYDMKAYNAGMSTIAEDIMKQLEKVNPWENPSHHLELNARWVRPLSSSSSPLVVPLPCRSPSFILVSHSPLSLLEYPPLVCD
jgi:hypothetical protein